jgi:hypothetical protein
MAVVGQSRLYGYSSDYIALPVRIDGVIGRERRGDVPDR